MDAAGGRCGRKDGYGLDPRSLCGIEGKREKSVSGAGIPADTKIGEGTEWMLLNG